jgi:hypothetical protein
MSASASPGPRNNPNSRRETTSNLISQVAKQMLQGAAFPDYGNHVPLFDVVAKSDQVNYSAAVYSYLQTLKGGLTNGPAQSARPGWICQNTIAS